MKLTYSRRSLRHLQAIRDYIARDNPEAADQTVHRIRMAVNRLAGFPHSGRPGPRETRLLSVPDLPYIVVHRVDDDIVKIVAVFHTSRNRRE